MTTAFILAGGTWILLGFILALFFAIAHGYYSRSGSAINQHPYHDAHGDAPGPPSRARSAATSSAGTTRAARAEVTGLVLLLAAAVDSISRRGREQSGRA